MFPPHCRLALGPEWGRPAAVAAFPPGQTPPQPPMSLFKGSPRQAAAVLYSRSTRGAGRGHPTPTPRVCAGLSGALCGNRPSCRAQPLRRAGARGLSSVWDGSGAQLGKNPSAAGGGGRRGGDVPSYRLFCKPLKGHGVGVGNCPSCTLTQAPADEGEGWLGWCSFPPSGRFH